MRVLLYGMGRVWEGRAGGGQFLGGRSFRPSNPNYALTSPRAIKTKTNTGLAAVVIDGERFPVEGGREQGPWMQVCAHVFDAVWFSVYLYFCVYN